MSIEEIAHILRNTTSCGNKIPDNFQKGAAPAHVIAKRFAAIFVSGGNMNRRLENVVNKVKQSAKYIALIYAILLRSHAIAKADYDLPFYHSIDANNSSSVVPDTFNAVGSSTAKNVIKPNPPSGDYVQAYTTVSGENLTKEVQEVNDIPDNTWNINLNAYDDNSIGLSGTANFNLTDSNTVNNLPPYALAIVQRQEPNGAPIQNYNLKEDPNISWPVTLVKDIHAKMELIVIDEYLRIKALSPTNSTINFKHFAVFANDWGKTGPLTGDINGNDKVDYEDLAMITGNWLYDGN